MVQDGGAIPCYPGGLAVPDVPPLLCPHNGTVLLLP
jgi:hypothetical protein